MAEPVFVPLEPFAPRESPEEASRRFYDLMRKRRTVRHFSDRPVSRQVIENIIRAAGSAQGPSAAERRPPAPGPAPRPSARLGPASAAPARALRVTPPGSPAGTP